MENRELYKMIEMVNKDDPSMKDEISIIKENSNTLDWRFISSDVKLQ